MKGIDHGGYRSVFTYSGGRETMRRLPVHQAVLLAYVGPPELGQETRHLDGDRANNHLSNLRWGTPQENSDDKRRHGSILRGERSGSAKLTEKEVLEIRKLRGMFTLRELAARYGVSHTAIRRAANGASWNHLADEEVA